MDRATCGSGLLGPVVESELSMTVPSEDQQTAFLWECQRMDPPRNQKADFPH